MMTKDQVLELIRDHLADELDLDPGKIQEATRFKEDLEADSLDLYTLVQELEDTYGVRISDEEAAKILTVGQVVADQREHLVVRPGRHRRAIAVAVERTGRVVVGRVGDLMRSVAG